MAHFIRRLFSIILSFALIIQYSAVLISEVAAMDTNSIAEYQADDSIMDEITGAEAETEEDSVDQEPLLNPFQDVAEESYYYDAVVYLYHSGLVTGVTEETFEPDKVTSIAECVTLAVRIYEMYHGLNTDFSNHDRETWYALYEEKAREYGLITETFADMNASITRKQAFYILYRIYPKEELTKIREFYRSPDLYPSDSQYHEIVTLYESGVVNGVDQYGTLAAENNLTRGQLATIMSRLIQPELRITEPFELESGIQAFHADEAPLNNLFTDVLPEAWYYECVSVLYNLGLVKGMTETTFVPDGTVSVAQAITVAVRVYETYHGLTASENATWYDGYVELALEYGIISPGFATNYERAITRSEVAYLVYHSMESELTKLNEVTSIPDIDSSDIYYAEILALYEAGVVCGTDDYGTFYGEQNIKRSELAAMFTRLVSPSRRMSFILKRDLTEVQQIVNTALASYSGTWSVYVSDVKTGSSFSVNNESMWSASVIKLYVMAAVLDAIETGKLTNSSTIQSELKSMITVSSNSAWKSLASRLGDGVYSTGMKYVMQYCQEHGYLETGYNPNNNPYNYTSVEDTGLFLERILSGINVSADASAQMLSLLKAQTRVSKIPAGVPSDVVTANKTGELNAIQNDAAIIFAPSGTYVLVVMTNGGSVANIKKLSKLVYNAMNG